MKDDLEVSATRRPPGAGWWVDGRCGVVLAATLFASILFQAAFAFRRAPEAAEQAPSFVAAVLVFRLVSYVWLGCLLAPLNVVLRRAWAYISLVLAFDVILLVHSLGLARDGDPLGRPAFGSMGVRISAVLSLLLLAFALIRSLSGTFKAGVETTRLYGRAR